MGIIAISIGNAEGSLEKSLKYSNERYQGGNLIKNHSAVKKLLGEAISQVETIRYALYGLAQKFPNIPLISVYSLWNTARDLCLNATSNALQVFGGYGYMEDYRIEKRLRDIMTLRSLPPQHIQCFFRIFECAGGSLW